MDTQPYLRTQAELLADLEDQLHDTSNARWSDATFYRALNEALLTWHGRVALPHLYTISGGWVTGTYAYALPAYVRPPVTAEVYRPIPTYDSYIDINTTHTWQEMDADTEPDGSGGLTLRLPFSPYSYQGRVRWYAPNSRVPTTVPTTNASITSSDTSVTLGGAVDVDDVGYIKIDAEWLAYYGVTRGSATTTLTNLLRGLYGTTAASHNSGATVTWGVGVDDMRLYNQLYDQAQAFLYRRLINDGSTHEGGRYERLLQYAQDRADRFWGSYVPVRRALRLKPSRKMYAWT